MLDIECLFAKRCRSRAQKLLHSNEYRRERRAKATRKPLPASENRSQARA